MSSMMRGPLNNSPFKIVNVSSIIINNPTTENDVSDDDSDKDILHIEESTEIDDSDSNGQEAAIVSLYCQAIFY